ncbi:hypothetical protein MMC22_002874 [Lobaria immixta]|nr:hypothetical protein [Lobaria immixta]
MARSDEAEWWFNAVYEAVQEIPRGYVTSYGHIARLLGKRTEPFFHDDNVPWQRVINAKGIISPRGPGGAARQAAALRREGVTVDPGPLGELTVDLVAFGWFPSTLPSEEAEASESSEGREG